MLTPFTPVSAAEEAASETTEVTRVEEVVSLRETNSETYLMSDGTYQCVIYSEDKYFDDGTDTLKLIDNTIKAADASTLSNPVYTNTAGFFDVTFGASGTPNVTVTLNENSVSFSPLGASGGSGNHMVADDYAVLIGKVENNAALDHLTATGSNTITYSNAFSGTDLVYVLANQGLKEYIVLNSSASPNAFSFLFEMDGLTLQSEDGHNYFADAAGNAVFSLGSLFAVDANGKPTDALTYDFVPVKGNADQVIVTVTLDNDYLTAADRAFPVVIDPTVTVTVSSSQTADTCVCSYFPSTNYYLATSLRTGYDSDYGIRRSYLKFNIPTSIPAGSVTNATLDIERVAGAIPTTRAYRVTSSWSSSTLTWNTFGTSSHYDTSTPSSQSVIFREGSAWYTMNVTSIVSTWVNNPSSNYGFVVIDANESNPDHWTTWYSSDAVSPHKPELIITYEGSSSGGGSGSGGAVLIGVPDSSASHDHSSALTTIKPILESCGYGPVNKYVGSFTEATIDAYLSSTTNKIFVSRSHGEAVIDDGADGLQYTSIILNGSDHSVIYNINSIPANISNMELVVFVGCVTGYGGEGAENLPTYAVRRGATTAIGFKEIITCTGANTWTEGFFALLEDGYTVSQACSELAYQGFAIDGNLDSYVICGSKVLTIG